MIKRALLLLSLAGLYIAYKQLSGERESPLDEHIADAQWASEGGGNAPASV